MQGVEYPASSLRVEHWIMLVKRWRDHGMWPSTLEFAPNLPDRCECPRDILEQLGYWPPEQKEKRA